PHHLASLPAPTRLAHGHAARCHGAAWHLDACAGASDTGSPPGCPPLLGCHGDSHHPALPPSFLSLLRFSLSSSPLPLYPPIIPVLPLLLFFSHIYSSFSFSFFSSSNSFPHLTYSCSPVSLTEPS